MIFFSLTFIGYLFDVFLNFTNIFRDLLDVFLNLIHVLLDLINVFLDLINILTNFLNVSLNVLDVLAHLSELLCLAVYRHLDKYREIYRFERDDRGEHEEHDVPRDQMKEGYDKTRGKKKCVDDERGHRPDSSDYFLDKGLLWHLVDLSIVGWNEFINELQLWGEIYKPLSA